MGVSTDGIIAFGVPCEEGAQFPWWEEEIEEWWRAEHGFVDVHEPWTPEGDYAEGWEYGDPRLDEYHAHRKEWLEDNPLPELVNYCSGECPMYAITIPGRGLVCHRGYPQTFQPSQLVVKKEEVEALEAFLAKYHLEYEGKPRWLLLSYWG